MRAKLAPSTVSYKLMLISRLIYTFGDALRSPVDQTGRFCQLVPTHNEFFDTLLRTQFETRQAVLEVIRRGVYSYPPGENPDGVGSTDETHLKRPRHELPPGAPPGPPQIPQNFCKACGRAGHGWDSCAFKTHGHPDHNPDGTVPWRQSVPGEAWLQKGWKVCPVRMTLSGKPYDSKKLGESLRK